MSDARTQAIHKAATELVQELLNATKEPGGERWFHIIVRKMEGLPDRGASPPVVNSKLPLRIGTYELGHLAGRIVVTRVVRRHLNNPGGDNAYEIEHWEPKEIAKLRLWLNGE